jgi:hypothetical protein
LVETVVPKAKTEVNRVATPIEKAQRISLCFVLETTRRMTHYISSVKDQIVQIAKEVQPSICSIIIELSCLECKDLDSDGKLYLYNVYIFWFQSSDNIFVATS